MKISLILCTIDRTEEVVSFLFSLREQTYTNFEVIIVDQNKDNSVKNILHNFDDLDIKYLQSKPGLSRARNIGLTQISGEIVGFPDDDCTYPIKLLDNINHFFKHNNYDILMGKTIDKKTKQIVAGSLLTTKCNLSCSRILGTSTTLFIHRQKMNSFTFDEMFGLGAKYHAEEENDLVLRLLKNGYTGYYHPQINFVYHPPSDLNYKDYKRIKTRSIGLGAFIAKHIKSLCGIGYFFKYNLIRPLIASILYMLKFDRIRSKYYFYKFLGIWKGFFTYLKEAKR